MFEMVRVEGTSYMYIPIQMRVQSVHRGDGVNSYGEDSAMVVQPLGAGQLHVRRYKRIVLGRLFDHNGQIEFAHI